MPDVHPPTQKQRPTAEVTASIAAKALKVREAANGLTQRIQQFEAYLAELPGRVEAISYGEHPEIPKQKFGLRLHRLGKDWVLSYCENGGLFEKEDWRSFREAPLWFKIVGVELFPDLLVSIEESQDTLIGCINNASTTYDNFAQTLNMKPKRAGITESEADLLNKLAESPSPKVVAIAQSNRVISSRVISTGGK
jgi:hypothetical protein